MSLARLLFVVASASCVSGTKPHPTLAESTPDASPVGESPEFSHANSVQSAPLIRSPTLAADFTRERTLIEESESARKVSDYTTARANAAEAVTSLVARPEAEQDAAWLELLYSAGVAAWHSQDARTANDAWQRVFDVRSLSLATDHPDLQRVRSNLASTIKALGDLVGARALQEKVLEIYSRTLPDDHPNLQKARLSLAATIGDLGDLQGALGLQEKVLEMYSRTLPDDHSDLQHARLNLAATIKDLGNLQGARALQEQVLDIYSRTLPSDHPDLQAVRGNLAATLSDLGDLPRAKALFEQVLEVNSRTLPGDHPNLQAARMNLANANRQLGDLHGARTAFEQVLEVLSRTRSDDHPQLQRARGNLAATLYALGDLAGARALQEKVLEGLSRSLPDDHPRLQLARKNLAGTLQQLGDPEGAKALYEKVLGIDTRNLPDDHPELQLTRLNLAIAFESLGDLHRAKAGFEQVLEVQSRTLPSDHPQLQIARGSLAGMMKALGDLQAARSLFEQVLEVGSRSLPDDHPDLQRTRFNLASTIVRQIARESQATQEKEATERTRGLERERCAELIGDLCRAQVHAARNAIRESPGREAEERCSHSAMSLDLSLSFVQGYGVFDPLHGLESESFAVAETTRGAALVSSGLTRIAAREPKYGELRDELREASGGLASIAQRGTTSEEFDRARITRELAERNLVALGRELSGGSESGVEFSVELLAPRLEKGGAAVGFRRFEKARVATVDELDSTGQPIVRETKVASLCAFVVRGAEAGSQIDSSLLTLVDLGPIEPIEEAVRAWRGGLGVGSDNRGVATGARAASNLTASARGTALRERIFDPLLPSLAGAHRIVVVLDELLHLVPLDALPIDERSLVGDRWQIETRATLTELLQAPAPSMTMGPLVAFGDAEYGAVRIDNQAGAAIELAVVADEPRRADQAGILRGSVWSEGFAALPGTGVEVRGIVRCYVDQFGTDAELELCERGGATRERLLTAAPRARWLHIATHGWFASESIKSWSDQEPLDKLSGLGIRVSGEEQVKGMSPMLLCGLALAGANHPETTTGHVPGLVTAEELSTLDLTNCELVVLSACDTNVGERRAGQGVASLQKALQMAGARSVITSLWKVPDEATTDLMLDFYRRLWVEKKPKWQALWEAKLRLRGATDQSGRPKYSTRDWAAWVLTGHPI